MHACRACRITNSGRSQRLTGHRETVKSLCLCIISQYLLLRPWSGAESSGRGQTGALYAPPTRSTLCDAPGERRQKCALEAAGGQTCCCLAGPRLSSAEPASDARPIAAPPGPAKDTIFRLIAPCKRRTHLPCSGANPLTNC